MGVDSNDPDELLRDLGRRVAELRAARGLTQQQFAEELEVTVRYLQGIEAGGENLSVRSLSKLADALEVEVRALFDEPTTRTVRVGRPPKSE